MEGGRSRPLFSTDGKRAGGETKRRGGGGDGDVTVGPHGESANSSFVEPPMTTSSPRRFLAGWAAAAKFVR